MGVYAAKIQHNNKQIISSKKTSRFFLLFFHNAESIFVIDQ